MKIPPLLKHRRGSKLLEAGDPINDTPGPERKLLPMKLRNLLLAIVAVAVFTVSTVPAEAFAHHHHRHHHHHHSH